MPPKNDGRREAGGNSNNHSNTHSPANTHGGISDYVRQLHEHLLALSLEASQTRQPLLQAMLSELGSTVEELAVTEEELRVQNEQLAEVNHALTGERQRYQELFDAAPDAYLVTDKAGVIQDANRAAVGLLGLSRRFLLGKPLAVFVSTKDGPGFWQALRGAVQSSPPEEWELRLQPRRGAAVSVGVMVAAVTGGGSGASLRWIIRDISLRRAAEAERYRLLVEGVKDYAVFMLDPSGLVTNWNAGAERLLGYRADEIIGRPGSLIFTPEDRAAGGPEQEMVTAAETGRAEDERWHLRKGGERFWGSGVMTALRDPAGGLDAYAKVMRDMTTRHQEEEQKTADLLKHRHAAEVFQHAVLQPVAADAFPGLAVAALYQAAWREADLGGDFYDAYPLGGGRVAFVVGDVSGKGLEAARRTAEVKFAARMALHQHADPAAAVAALNRFLCESLNAEDEFSNILVVLAVAVVDSSGRMEMVFAGCEPALVVRADGTPVTLPSGSLPLGVLSDAAYAVSSGRLEPGDTLLLMTDGITEARNAERRFLGYEGAVALARRSLPSEATPSAGEAIMEGARAFAGGHLQDDACLLLVRRL